MPHKPLPATHPHTDAIFSKLLSMFRRTEHPATLDAEVGSPENDMSREQAAQEAWRKSMVLAVDRTERYRIFNEMDNGNAASVADLYAEEATQEDPDKRRTVWVESSDASIVTEGNQCLSNLNADALANPIARKLVVLGDHFRKIAYAPGSGVFGWQAVSDPGKIDRHEDNISRLVGFSNKGETYRGELKRTISWPWDYTHFRLPGKYDETGYGTAVFDTMFQPWRMLELAEASKLLYMIRRAPDRNAVMVDVGDLDDDEALEYVNRWRKSFRKTEMLDPACLSLTQVIRTLKGDRTLAQIIDAKANGESVLVYGYDEKTKKVMPGEVSWAGVTRKKAELVEVTIDDGAVVRCTPDHPFAVMDSTLPKRGPVPAGVATGIKWVEAKDLKAGDQLVPLRFSSHLKGGRHKRAKGLIPVANHQVVSVRTLDWKEDTGDITVPALSCFFVADRGNGGVLVHNSPNYSKQFNALTPFEDLFIPTRGSDTSSRIETLSGSGSADNVYDLNYYRDKFYGAARINKAAMGIGDAGTINSKANLSQQDIRFARSVIRVQRAVAMGFRSTCELHFVLRGLAKSELPKFKIQMHPISYLAEMERIEVVRMRVELMEAMGNLANTMQMDTKVWSAYILSEIAKIPDTLAKKLLAKTPSVPGEPGAAADTAGAATKKTAEGFYPLSAAEKKQIVECIASSPGLRSAINNLAGIHKDSIDEQVDLTLTDIYGAANDKAVAEARGAKYVALMEDLKLNNNKVRLQG